MIITYLNHSKIWWFSYLCVIIHSQTSLSGNFNKHLIVLDYFDDNLLLSKLNTNLYVVNSNVIIILDNN